jgi:hypothetical protein
VDLKPFVIQIFELDIHILLGKHRSHFRQERKGFVFSGEASFPFCPSDQTAISLVPANRAFSNPCSVACFENSSLTVPSPSG